MFGLFGGGGLSADDAARLRRVERKLDAVLAHLGVPAPDAADLSAQAKLYADSGQTIDAIRQYRQDTGAGLAEAKRVIEEYLGRYEDRGMKRG